jgi:hypothetical protein
MKYSKQATVEFAKNINKEECLEPINQLVVKEGFCEEILLDDDILLINMDCVEAKVASSQKKTFNKSMDSAFLTKDSTGTKQEIVFVEYRFNYQNMKNLKKEELFGKVAGSTSALNTPPNIHEDYYFVFNSNLKQQAISRFNRMNPAMPQHYKPIDMTDVKNLFFD